MALGLENFLSGQFFTTTWYLAVISSSNRSYAMRVMGAPVRVPMGNVFSEAL